MGKRHRSSHKPRNSRYSRRTGNGSRSRSRSCSSQGASILDKRSRRRKKSESNSTIESINQFTQAITALVENTTSRSNHVPMKGDAVPYFNPDDLNQTSETWCKKIDELRGIFNWTEQQTIYFALAKLQGLAAVWYKGLGTINYTWDEWKRKVEEAFPGRKEFIDLIMEMVKRKKKPEESYATYYHEKMALLNACKIYGSDAVSCIIGGIEDYVVKTGAKAGQHSSPESLFKYLSAFNNSSTSYQSSNYYQQRFKNPKRNERHQERKREYKHSSRDPTCFKCGKVGHYANKCEAKPKEKRCIQCNNRFHDESNCPKKPEGKKNTVA